MSAICGIFQRNGAPLLPSALDPIMGEMRHYGLEGGNTWHVGSILFGHQMTHVTSESLNEILPFNQTESGMAITADARLDNRDELFSLLEIPYSERAQFPDSYLILRAYQHWSSDCALNLLGDFAFAIWNDRSKELFCARDCMGIKPFYYIMKNSTFYFASDMKALVGAPDEKPEVNLNYVRAYLEYPGFYHKEFTFYEDTFKLGPAQSLIVRPGNHQRWSYWTPSSNEQIHYKQEKEYAEHLRELVERAVKDRLRSAFPLGAHLTGGLDSSTVSVIASREIKKKGQALHVFSWAPPPEPEDFPLEDERAIIENLSAVESMMVHYSTLKTNDFIHEINPDITTQSNQFSLEENDVARQASGLGIRVLLSGWGGDEIPAFNGRGYFAELFSRIHWRILLRELYLRARLQEWSIWEGFRNSVLLPLIPDWLLSLTRPNSWQLPQARPLPKSLTPDFSSKLLKVKALRRVNLRERPGVHRNQITLITDGHLTDRMESWAALGSTHGIEYRYPLTDRRIIEFCLRVPSWLYFKNGWKRYMFRLVAESYLPAEAQWKRVKTDPAWINFRKANANLGYSKTLEDLRSRQGAIQSMGYVDPDELIRELESIQEEASKGVPVTKMQINDPPVWLANLGKDYKQPG